MANLPKQKPQEKRREDYEPEELGREQTKDHHVG